MRQHSEAMQGTKAPPQALRRRLAARLSLLASTLGLLVFCGSAAASPPVITSISGGHCDGELLTLTGTNFGKGPYPEYATVHFTDPFGSPYSVKEVAVVTSNTTAYTFVPTFATSALGDLGELELKLPPTSAPISFFFAPC
jgi:hypothetical protein